MNTDIQQRKHAYRWVVLVIVFFTQVILNIDMFQLAGLAAKIIPDMGLRPNEFAMVLSVPLLTCAILGIVSGALADRFGVKIVIGIGLIISAAATVFRINADDFLTLFLWMLTLGVGMAALNSNAAKLLGAWFGHEQMGMVMGIYVAAANVGISIALSTSALFPSVNTAFTVSAVISVIMTVMWFLSIRSKPENAPTESTQSMFSYLGVAAKSKGVWAGAIAMFFFMGSYVTHSGFLSNALTESKGISSVTAGLAASVLSLSLIAGTVIVPLIYAKTGSSKPFLTIPTIMAAILAYASWVIPFSSLTILLLALNGFVLGSVAPIFMSLPMSLPEIGPVYAGSAGGIISTMQMAGAFFLSSYIIIPIAGANADHVFLYCAFGYLALSMVTVFVRRYSRH